jgi:dethiobiotin synthetase
MRAPNVAIAVTGTDTGVGKTVVSRALVGALRARGLGVAAMKPVETGVDGGLPPDAMQLRRAAGDRDAIDVVCPYVYAEPLAPAVAAARAERPIDVARLDGAFAQLAATRDAIVVEGAGGLLVPFTRDATFADLVVRWQLDVIVVAANRLGVLNHTMLTVREAERRGVRVRAVVLNDACADTSVAAATNASTLSGLLGAIPLVVFPQLDLSALADDAELARVAGPLAELCLAST